MNSFTQLRESLHFFTEEEYSKNSKKIEFFLYALVPSENGKDFFDIKEIEAHDGGLKEDIIKTINTKILSLDDSFSLEPLSKADVGSKCYYLYDLDKPKENNEIKFFLDLQISNRKRTKKSSIDKSSLPRLERKELKKVDYLLFCLRIAKNDFFFVVKNKKNKALKTYIAVYFSNSLKIIEPEDSLNIDTNFTIIVSEDNLIFTENSYVESFEFVRKEIEDKARDSFDVIRKLSLLDEDDLNLIYDKYLNLTSEGTLKSNMSICKKLIKVVEESKVIEKGIKSDEIIKFVSESNNKGRKRIKLQIDETNKSLIVKNLSDVRTFLSLLADDFLVSRLTNESYLVNSKKNN